MSLQEFFSPSGLTAHGFCLSWSPGLMALHAGSDAAIGLSYFSIPIALAALVRQRRDISHSWILYLFIAFILTCGTTHFFSILTLWVPAYDSEGLAKLVTALFSVSTALLLWPLIPRLVALPTTGQLVALNQNLSQRIAEHEQTLQLLRESEANGRAANRELEAFSYSVAHDLRAPLRSIDGFSQILLEECSDRLDDEHKTHLAYLRGSAQRMAQLIDDLLALSRLTRADLRPEPVDLVAVSHDILSRLRHDDPDRKVAFHAPDRLMVEGDAGLLTLALENLLGNAWKFSRQLADADITLGTLIQEDRRVYFVRDNGAGFNMAYVAKLFTAFQRLHTTDEFEGSGIGLTTVQRVIERHGGRIWAEGAEGKGATFYFTLGTA